MKCEDEELYERCCTGELTGDDLSDICRLTVNRGDRGRVLQTTA
jgi:hypothetical protein